MSSSPPIPAGEQQQALEALVGQGRFAEAVALQGRIVQASPARMGPRLDLAHLLMRAGDFDGSARVLAEAAQLPEADPAAMIALARRLHFSGEVLLARECIDRLEQLPGTAHLHAAIAHLRWMTGEVPRALEWIERAFRSGLRAPAELHMQAMLCHFSGDRRRAEQLLDMCLDQWPDFGPAASARANLRKQAVADSHVPSLRRCLAQLPAADVPAQALNRAQFEAALAKELDDLGESREAWQALSRSKTALRALNPYDPAAEEALTGALITAIRAHVAPVDFAPDARPEGPTPIFIVGMPRSGSTLLDRMISAHPDVAPAGEINDFLRQLHRLANVPPSGHAGMHRVLERLDRVDPSELGRRYLQQTAWRAGGRRYYVDKLPINVQLAPLIRRALPHAPILHLVRDPMDVCFSNYRAMFGDVSPWCNDLAWVAHFHGQYQRIADAWRRHYPSAMTEVSYADLVDRPADILRPLFRGWGLAFDDACLHPERNPHPVTTPSAGQVREPMHRRGLATWQPYAEWLGPLRQALAGAARAVPAA